MTNGGLETGLQQDSCPFCAIAKGLAPATIVYQDDEVLAFRDRNPRALVHILVIPRRHIANLYEISEDDQHLLGHLMRTLPVIARSQGLMQGFKTQINSGSAGGQEVFHLHVHLTGAPA
ncbi:histidine triad nucleotide-binding protein [Pokkaliibacter plantistimulans]|uniref:Histidine triad nucleotide-binding protein n=1 Tax=Proteobacteria bacterium 228 TaxID=2083153 RepID=A0A2S5KTI1_9PROT|nr:histidine triad nucleotide-binding protein [Pokkaliibacter plantistimulans]PPC78164.1 histidine triad nucleotide-binding protein [Pokkaliibacter plantistimulans]